MANHGPNLVRTTRASLALREASGGAVNHEVGVMRHLTEGVERKKRFEGISREPFVRGARDVGFLLDLYPLLVLKTDHCLVRRDKGLGETVINISK